ncbi:MAG: SseB family protein [Actinocatenispora sp.]
MSEFAPVNDLETRMAAALAVDDQESYLRLLATAELVLPADGAGGGTVWPTVVSDGQTFVAVYTSPTAMEVSTTGQFRSSRTVGFRELVADWPDPSWSLVVDPGLKLAANLSASLIRQMAGGEFTAVSAEPARVGDGHGYLPERPRADPAPALEPVDIDSEAVPTVMQKVIPPSHVSFYLDQGYDWVAGYVHRWQDTAELETVPDMVANLGLGYPGSPFTRDDTALYVLRWTAYRAELYRSPLGDTDETRLAEVPGGWVVEHPPFTGDGQVPYSRLDIPEYKIDSMRLPHQAEMWRISAGGGHRFVAVYDADEQRWLVNQNLAGEV